MCAVEKEEGGTKKMSGLDAFTAQAQMSFDSAAKEEQAKAHRPELYCQNCLGHDYINVVRQRGKGAASQGTSGITL